MDPSKNIVNTGSWIGDNAIPWALMLDTLKPDNPGKVIAIDPDQNFVKDMVDLANVNKVGNLCCQIGVLSSNNSRVAYIGTSTEHIKVYTEKFATSGTPKKKARFAARSSWTNAITLDSLNLQQSVSLLHLDVEGHEGELLEGARETIKSSRPIIITEGFDQWPEPTNTEDQHVASIMNELGYHHGNTIPESCGVRIHARNRIWWPDDKTRIAAMAIVGNDLNQKGDELIPWIAVDLPEQTE